MKTPNHSTLVAIGLLAGLAACPLGAADFESGSNGSFGELVVNGQSVRQVDLPPDGVLHCTTVKVDGISTLYFKRNALNTPVVLLATGDVVIEGGSGIHVSAGFGSATAGGVGGPGGFDGGAPGANPGAGQGPGGGRPGAHDRTAQGAGPGVFAEIANLGTDSTNRGAIYGNSLLFPIIGGSGGGGSPTMGGGGGGGAIVIASTTKIEIRGGISANGAPSADDNLVQNGGSGGAIRLIAPKVVMQGILRTDWQGPGFQNFRQRGSSGRIRIDTLDRSQMNGSFQGVTTIGGLMVVNPSPMPRLDIIEAAGTVISEGSGPVNVILPFGSSPNRTIKVQARDFGGSVPVQLVLTPEQGRPITYQGTINNAGGNPASATFNVTLPVNVLTFVNAYSR